LVDLRALFSNINNAQLVLEGRLVPGAYVKDDEECPRDLILDSYRPSAAERQEVS
jgi:hypothetical protein